MTMLIKLKIKPKISSEEDNSKPTVLPFNKKTESRKRKEPEKVSTELTNHAAFLGPDRSADQDIRVAQKLKSFSVYSRQEEEEEKLLGVSTQLKLFVPFSDGVCVLARTEEVPTCPKINVPVSEPCSRSRVPSGDGVCVLNRNPADFCLPDERSGFMIRGEDLGFARDQEVPVRPKVNVPVGTLSYQSRASLGDGVCVLNRNPADFCLPDESSGYMIRGEDLRDDDLLKRSFALCYQRICMNLANN